MTNIELEQYINDWIYTNGNNEITADTLNPVLQAIRSFTYGITGNKEDLSTTTQDTLVAAINEVLGLIVNYPNAILLIRGVEDPNVVAPPSYRIADFYLLVDGSNNPIQLYQYDGFSWIEIGGSNSANFNTIITYTGATITVPSGYSGVVYNMSNSLFCTYTVVGTTLTIGSNAENGDILNFTNN